MRRPGLHYRVYRCILDDSEWCPTSVGKGRGKGRGRGCRGIIAFIMFNIAVENIEETTHRPSV